MLAKDREAQTWDTWQKRHWSRVAGCCGETDAGEAAELVQLRGGVRALRLVALGVLLSGGLGGMKLPYRAFASALIFPIVTEAREHHASVFLVPISSAYANPLPLVFSPRKWARAPSSSSPRFTESWSPVPSLSCSFSTLLLARQPAAVRNPLAAEQTTAVT